MQLMWTQGSAATSSDGDDDDTEDDEDEEANHFLLPGDVGFENDRPEEKCDLEDKESVRKTSQGANNGLFLTNLGPAAWNSDKRRTTGKER